MSVVRKIIKRTAPSATAGKAIVRSAHKAPPPSKVAPKAGPPSPSQVGTQGPRLNINYKDLDPQEQDQAAKKAGLTPGPGALPPGVTTAAEQQMAASQKLPPAAEEKGEDPKEEANETPDQEKAEMDADDQSKNSIPVPEKHHAVRAHVRKNPISAVGKQKLARRGVVVK